MKNRDKLIYIFLTFFLITFYSFFIAPSTGCGDSGELIASAYSLGIPHPPGYPLYMITGRLFTLLIPGNPAMGLNLLSVLFLLFSSIIFYKFLRRKDIEWKIALIPVMLLIVHPLLIKFGTISEVYTMTVFFFLLELYLLHLNKHRILSYVTGLSFMVHPLLWLLNIYVIYRIAKENWKNMIFIIPGLSVFVYIYIRSFSNPYVNWGNIENFKNVLFHVLRVEYYSGSTGITLSKIRGELLIWLKILIKDCNFLLILLLFAFKRNDRYRNLLFLLILYSFPLVLMLNFEPSDLNMEANRVFFIPQLILILAISAEVLKNLEKKYMLFVAVFLFSVFVTRSYQERLFKRSWTAPDYINSVLAHVEDERKIMIEAGGDALTFPLLYADVAGKGLKVKINSPGLFINTDKEADYSTYRTGTFNYHYGLLFSSQKKNIIRWDFRIRRGRKDIMEDYLYVVSSARYAIFLYRKELYGRALYLLEELEKMAWLNDYMFVIGSTYMEVKEYALAERIFRKIIEKDPCFKNVYHRLYYSLLMQEKEEKANYVMAEGLMKKNYSDGDLLNDAGVFYVRKGFRASAFIFFMESILKDGEKAGTNLNKLIKEMTDE